MGLKIVALDVVKLGVWVEGTLVVKWEACTNFF